MAGRAVVEEGTGQRRGSARQQQVGCEDPAFFRRLTGVSPGQYRRQFRIPDYAMPQKAAAE